MFFVNDDISNIRVHWMKPELYGIKIRWFFFWDTLCMLVQVVANPLGQAFAYLAYLANIFGNGAFVYCVNIFGNPHTPMTGKIKS